jgi:riboflavin transporter FmnP
MEQNQVAAQSDLNVQDSTAQSANLGSVDKTAADETVNANPVNSSASGNGSGANTLYIQCKNYFTATRIAYIAVFTALAYILYMPIFEFNIIPAVSFLKVDFSNTFVMIAGFSLGPVAAIIVGILKELLHALTFSQTVGIGELSNILVMLPYILIPSIVYKKHKGIKIVIICLVIGCLAQTAMSVPVNYFINFPFFFSFDWEAGQSYYLSVWYWVVLFNLVKTILISIAVMLLYKPLSNLIKMTNKKFESAKNKRKNKIAEQN